MTSLQISSQEAAEELLLRRKARTKLLDFTQYTYPQYVADPFHVRLAEALDDVIAGDVKRLCIFAPPQNGKSELASVRLPAIWLGKRPNDPIVLTSYAASLAEDKSRSVRQIIESNEYAALFGHLGTRDAEPVTTRKDSRAVAAWHLGLPYRGGMRSAGVGGPITGHGGMLGIIDDPVENWEQAQSKVDREKKWEWYRRTFRTRIWEGGAILLIMCMTGDTPVLMADGTERPLREIKVGDQVATYDNGKLGVSRVLNHASNGSDSVFRIRMISGKIVHANERHPFLVEEHGELKWVRLRNLTTAHKIVSIKDIGKGKPVALRDATNLLAVEDIASTITVKRSGLMGIARHQTMRRPAETRGSNIAMESLPLSTMQCMKHRKGSALFANNHPETMCAHIGLGNSVLTTAMIRVQSGDSCATIAISPLDIPNQKQLHLLLSNTSDFTVESIASIEPAGIEEVFDIQVERTENFIANGLVSHNTRWHQDDLAGRLLNTTGEKWLVLRFPALAETQEERDKNDKFLGLPTGQPDLLGREPGEALSPSRFSAIELNTLKTEGAVGSLAFAAEYQGVPRAAEGNTFKRDWFPIVDAAPARAKRVRYWDKAGTQGGTGAASAGVLILKGEDRRYYIQDVVRGWYSSHQREIVIKQTAQLDAQRYNSKTAVKIYIEQEPGSSGKESAENTIKNLAGFLIERDLPSGDKDTRLQPFADQAEAGNVVLIRGDWNQDYIEEMIAIPNGARRDQGDATAGAFNRLNDADDAIGWQTGTVRW